MGTAWKVVIGLVLVLPMTAYVVGSLVAAAEEPQPHQPIIVQQTKTPNDPGKSPSAKPTEKPSGHKSGHKSEHAHNEPGDDNTPEVISPSPSIFDDNGGLEDNSGKGSGGDDDSSSGSGSGHG